MLNSVIIKVNFIYVQYNFFSVSNSRDNVLCLVQGIGKLKKVVKMGETCCSINEN